MSTWTNRQRPQTHAAGSSLGLLLSLTYSVDTDDRASWTNRAQTTDSWTNRIRSSSIYAGTPIGLLLALTYAEGFNTNVTWANRVKN